MDEFSKRKKTAKQPKTQLPKPQTPGRIETHNYEE